MPKHTYNVYDGPKWIGQVKAASQKEATEQAKRLGNRSKSLCVVRLKK